MQPKLFKAYHNAQRFQRKLKAFNPRVLTDIQHTVNDRFDTVYMVVAIVERAGDIVAVPCSPLTRENAAKVAHVR